MKLICPTANIFNKFVILKLKSLFDCNLKEMSQKKFEKVVHNFEIVLLRFNRYIPYKKKHKIKFILSPTTGEDHIDKRYFKDKNVKIITLKNKYKFLSTVNASSEFTILLILMTLRKITKTKNNYNIGYELLNKKVGIVGLGRNGKKICKIIKNFGAKIFYFDKKIQSSSFKYLNLNSLLKKCNIIIICIPYNSKNLNFINKTKINMIQNGSIIINTSRAGVLDENYILTQAKKEKIFYSSDVFSDEFSKNYLKKIKKLNTYSNIIITNHIGGLTYESINKTDNFIFDVFFKMINDIK